MAAKVGFQMGSWEAVGPTRMNGLARHPPGCLNYMFRMGKSLSKTNSFATASGGFRSRSNIFQYILRIKNPGKCSLKLSELCAPGKVCSART